MSIDIDDFTDPPDGWCQNCDEETEEEHHRLCADCFREAMGWRRPARPAPGTPPPSLVEGLAQLREQLGALAVSMDLLSERVEQLERRRAA